MLGLCALPSLCISIVFFLCILISTIHCSDTVTEADIAVMFRSFGAIESVRTLRAKTCAFVNFILLRNARNALETMQVCVILSIVFIVYLKTNKYNRIVSS